MDATTVPPDPAQNRQKNVFVLCFDGTGNKFSGTEADSNILKLYRMLDRTDATMYTFYQPGIGTYITSSSMQTTSRIGKIKSWYNKAKDSAIGSSFAEHVMGGYKFLMRYYSCEDDLYFFGFSRGAYTARFLAEMLDHIGLLSSGNQELTRFAWKTYSKWAARLNDGSDQALRDEAELYQFMSGFRETFSRPVRRIRFLGLFDTVNSVPRFESAWMQRSKFPYTARSSAKVIRHAVSIDERRAKFRQDLISGSQAQMEDKAHNPYITSRLHRYNSELKDMDDMLAVNGEEKRSRSSKSNSGKQKRGDDNYYDDKVLNRAFTMDRDDDDLTAHENDVGNRLTVPTAQKGGRISDSSLTGPPDIYNHLPKHMRRRWSDRKRVQDIQEVWFSGGHADIGGGWAQESGEEWMLSHAPLVWMVTEAHKAGLRFDHQKMAHFCCLPDRVDKYGDRINCPETAAAFKQAIEDSGTNGVIHDCLAVGPQLKAGAVYAWKFMEYLPFRRMDLQADGSWKAIRWPLPMGETRDIPADAQVHHTVIKRMQQDPKYRPGNLIVGGGGRGIRTAPKEYGMGEWEPHLWENDAVAMTFKKKP